MAWCGRLVPLAVLCALGPAAAGRAQPPILSTPDSAGDVGSDSAVAFGPDGLALITYYDATHSDLKLARCLDAACTRSTLSVLAHSAGRSSIAFGADGRARIAYASFAPPEVRLARCLDAGCSSVTHRRVDALQAATGYGVALAIGSDGRPVVAYAEGQPFSGPPPRPMRVARCSDPACTGVSIAELPEAARDPSLVIGVDGLPLIAYETASGGAVRIRHCTDAACAASTAVTASWVAVPDAPGSAIQGHSNASLALGPDGLPILAHDASAVVPGGPPPLPPVPQFFYGTHLRRCTDAACSALVPSQYVTRGTGIVAGSDANGPVAAAHRFLPSHGLVYARCPAPDCFDYTTELVATGMSYAGSMARGPFGAHLIAFYESSARDLGTAYMGDPGTADLAVAATVPAAPVLPGATVTWELRATNDGPVPAPFVSLTLRLAPGLELVSATGACVPAPSVIDCTAPDLAPGATAVVAGVTVRVGEVAPGDLQSTATLQSAVPDPDPSDNALVLTTRVDRWLEVEPVTAVEPDAGVAAAPFRVTLRDTVPPGASAVTVAFATVADTAQPGSDYVAASGSVTFAPGASSRTVEVGIVGDTVAEAVESFTLQLSSPTGASLRAPSAAGTILDDDFGATLGELQHGSVLTEAPTPATSAPPGVHHYRIAQAPRASYEVVVDAASGDLLPLEVARMGGAGTTVLQAGTAGGTGASVSLAWMSTAAAPDVSQLVRVASGGCTTGCGDDDAYRVRAYETTLRGPRFNNAGGQVTVLALSNPSDRPVAAHAWFFRGDGTLAGDAALALEPRASLTLDTSAIAPSASGSVVLAHDAPYGALAGKLVSLEPATGFAFDTPLTSRPR